MADRRVVALAVTLGLLVVTSCSSSHEAARRTSTTVPRRTSLPSSTTGAPRAPGSGPPPLRELADAHHLAIGTAVTDVGMPFLTDPRYAATLASEYNTVTPEFAMKWDALHPGPAVYDFKAADAIVDFARTHHMAVRGHTLTWYQANPSWLESGTFSRDQLIAILQDHIRTVVGHYKGRIEQWDVVNEGLGDDLKLRDNIWLRGIGPDYIRLAFEFAHEADPEARLYYNDYYNEDLGPKSDAVLKLVTDLKRDGVPVHGVGLQLHGGLRIPAMSDIAANMRRLGDAGFDVAITEFDVKLDLPLPAWELDAQRVVYHDLLATCLAAPACHTFMTWGFTDAHSYVPQYFRGFGAALPFDESYRPKAAYDGMRDALLSASRD